MVNDIKSSSELRPSYVEKPDIRFATTFLSNKYRDFSVKGESIMDKETGEMFVRRPSDGRVVSFFQNKKYMHELMLELRILLNNNLGFKYPSETDVNAFYLNTDYDLTCINDDRVCDVFMNDTIIPNTDDTQIHKLEFKVSPSSSGFFCRVTSRDCDKAILEWISTQYNSICKDYTGDNENFLIESRKFSNDRWADSNAVINYTVETITEDGNISSYDFKEYVHINEECCVMFERNFSSENLKSLKVIINSITYDKIHFMINHKDELGIPFITGFNKFVNSDNVANVYYCNIGSFVDSSDDINLLGNEFIVSMIDMPYVYRYMMKMTKLVDGGNIVLSPDKPSSDIWRTNGLWAESVRNVYKDGVSVDQGCSFDIKTFERYLATGNGVSPVKFTTDVNDTNNIYLKEI